MLLKDARAFASVAWTQTGFTHARASHPDDTTTRNLFGQVDGSANPTRGSDTAERIVWGVGSGDGRGTKDLRPWRSEEHTSELQSRFDLVCRLLLAQKKQIIPTIHRS